MRLAAIALLAAMLVPATIGCYGQFPITKAVYRFNGRVSDDKWVHSLLMWGFLILPVYSVSMLGDAIIFNLIQFWTGQSLKIGSVTERDGVRATLAPSPGGREVTLTLSRDGRVLRQECFVRVSPAMCEMRDRAGRLTARIVKTDRGDLQLLDPAGILLGRIPSEALGKM